MIAIVAAILGLFAGAAAVTGEPLRFYLDPEGNDTENGATPEAALLTLSRVHEILEEKRPDRDVEVLIGPGTYHGMQTRWTYTHPDHSIGFRPADPEAKRPVFDACDPDDKEGSCGGGTWFTLVHSSGEPTNLEFDSLRIQNYQTAISFNGNRSDIHASNGRNSIRNCYFYRIGNIANPEGIRPSTAAVRLVNSKENRIDNNDFIDIINIGAPNRLHALYLAHHADSNRIHNNRFVNNSGDAVRVRDFSNANRITANAFDRAGQGGAFSEWYCDHDARDDCTKATPECPSWLNEFRGNRIGTNFNGDPLEEHVFYQGDSTTGCEPPAPGASRLITEDNGRL